MNRYDWPHRVLYTCIVLVVSALLMGAVMAWWVDHRVMQSERGLCGLLALSANPSPQPMTDRGVRMQREARRLYDRYGCASVPRAVGGGDR